MEAAIADAGRERRARLMYFRADWAVHSAQLERELWPDAAVRRASVGVIAVMIDLTDVEEPNSEEIVARHDVQVLPTIIVVRRDGTEEARLTGLPDPARVVTALERAR